MIMNLYYYYLIDRFYSSQSKKNSSLSPSWADTKLMYLWLKSVPMCLPTAKWPLTEISSFPSEIDVGEWNRKCAKNVVNLERFVYTHIVLNSNFVWFICKKNILRCKSTYFTIYTQLIDAIHIIFIWSRSNYYWDE